MGGKTGFNLSTSKGKKEGGVGKKAVHPRLDLRKEREQE